MSDQVTDSSSRPQIIDKLTNRVTMLGGLVAAVVTLNTSITSCSSDNIKRHDDFRAAVTAEEQYWRGLYNDYLATFDENIDEDQRDAKRQALRALANHSVPNFKEHRLGFFFGDTKLQEESYQNIVSIKKSLIDALLDKVANGATATEAISAAQDTIFANEEQSKARERSPDATVTPAAQAEAVTEAEVRPTIATSVLSYQAQTIAAGSEKGWDFDIFWCAGPNERQNFTQAGSVAQIIATRANAGQTLSDGSSIGRVRVRSLPESRQYKGSGYPSSGYLVRSERGSERKVADALVQLLNSEQQPRFSVDTIGMKTPYYLSLFVCGVKGNVLQNPPALSATKR